MPIVEMLGPSGVGKTTLAKAVLERMSASGWTDQYAAFERSQMDGGGWPPPSLALHRHLLALKRAGRLRPSRHTEIEEVETFQITMELAISVNTPAALVLADEFLLMHFMQEFKALAKTEPSVAASLLSYRHIVFVRNDPRTNLRQFLERKQDGIERPYIDTMSETEFLSYSHGFDAEMMAFRDILTQAGATSTVIDLRAGFSPSVEACCGFLADVDRNMRHAGQWAE